MLLLKPRAAACLSAAMLLATCNAGARGQAGPQAPAYLQHGDDKVQQAYSRLLLALAVDKRCHFLEPATGLDFQKYVTGEAAGIFQGYVYFYGFAATPKAAVDYPLAMADGAVRAAGSRPCDEQNRKFVLDTAAHKEAFDDFLDAEE